MYKKRNTTCCFTGHRDLKNEEKEKIWNLLCNKLFLLYQIGYRQFCSGGALGFDTMAAASVLWLKTKYNDVKLILVLPCKRQEARWTEHDQTVYKRMLSCADEIIYTSEEYFTGCMHIRNNRLIDMSSFCIAYQQHPSGGSYYTVKRAVSEGIEVYNIAQLSRQQIKEGLDMVKIRGHYMKAKVKK